MRLPFFAQNVICSLFLGHSCAGLSGYTPDFLSSSGRPRNGIRSKVGSSDSLASGIPCLPSCREPGQQCYNASMCCDLSVVVWSNLRQKKGFIMFQAFQLQRAAGATS